MEEEPKKDEFAELISTIKNASALAPTTYNNLDLAWTSSQIDAHIEAIDSMVQEDILKASSALSNLEVLSNIYNGLMLEEQDVDSELNKIRKMATEVSSISSQISTQRAVLFRLSSLLDKEIESKENIYSMLSAGYSPLDLEMKKYGMTLMDFLQLPQRAPSSEVVKQQITKFAEEKLNGEEDEGQ